MVKSLLGLNFIYHNIAFDSSVSCCCCLQNSCKCELWIDLSHFFKVLYFMRTQCKYSYSCAWSL